MAGLKIDSEKVETNRYSIKINAIDNRLSIDSSNPAASQWRCQKKKTLEGRKWRHVPFNDVILL